MPQPDLAKVSLRERLGLLLGAGTWILLTGVFDYVTGIEYRVFPLYVLPILLVGWRLGYASTLVAAVLSAGCWLASNYLGGLVYSSPTVWIVNTIAQLASFGIVGALVVMARRSYWLAEARSRTDSLTGLPNMRAFADEAVRTIGLCERHKRCVTVAYLDLDHFKQVNDRFGHARGDQVLATVAATLRLAARDTDLVTRLGGDEFAMLLPGADVEGAAIVLERTRASVMRALEGEPVGVTVSIGAVTSLGSHPNAEEFLKQADARLYQAKEAGKNRVVLDQLTP